MLKDFIAYDPQEGWNSTTTTTTDDDFDITDEDVDRVYLLLVTAMAFKHANERFDYALLANDDDGSHDVVAAEELFDLARINLELAALAL